MTLPFLFCVAQPNFQEAGTRADTVRGKLDLLRLETARKLYTLEKGSAPAKLADLALADLPQIPADVFAAEKATFKESEKGFYSLGPDRKDNANAIAYDPTNGTLSVGDIALGRGEGEAQPRAAVPHRARAGARARARARKC